MFALLCLGIVVSLCLFAVEAVMKRKIEIKPTVHFQSEVKLEFNELVLRWDKVVGLLEREAAKNDPWSKYKLTEIRDMTPKVKDAFR